MSEELPGLLIRAKIPTRGLHVERCGFCGTPIGTGGYGYDPRHGLEDCFDVFRKRIEALEALHGQPAKEE